MNERERPSGFDSYHQLLGIPPAEQPPNHYRLLGIAPFEQDPDVISGAADKQMAHVRTFQTGKHSAESQTLLNELAAARIELLNPQKKAAYDQQLRQQNIPPPPPVVQGQERTPTIVTSSEPVRRGVNKRTKVIAGVTAVSAAAALALVALLMSGKKGDTGKSGVEKNPPTPVVKTLTPEEEEGMTMHQPIVKPVDPIEPSSVDPEVERLKEEEKRLRKGLAAEKAEAERLQQFETDIQFAMDKLEQQNENWSPRYMVSLATIEQNPVAKEALIRAAKKRMAKEVQENTKASAFQVKVSSEFKSISENPDYAKLKPDALIDAANGEGVVPETRAGLILAAIKQMADAKDLEGMEEAMDQLEDGDMSDSQILALRLYFYKMFDPRKTSNPDRAAIGSSLLEGTWDAYDEGDYKIAGEAVETANIFVNGKREIDPTTGKVVRVIVPSVYSPGVMDVRDAVGRGIVRHARFQELHERAKAGFDDEGNVVTPTAFFDLGVYEIATQGSWSTAMGPLSLCGNLDVAAAAKLDMAGPKTPEEMLACAKAWMAAAKSVSQTEDLSLARGAFLARSAFQYNGAVEEGLTGKLKLDAGLLKRVLEGKDVDLDNPDVGSERWVNGREGKKAQAPKVVKEETLTPGERAALLAKNGWHEVDLSRIYKFKGVSLTNGEVVLSENAFCEIPGKFAGESFEILIRLKVKSAGEFVAVHVPTANPKGDEGQVWVVFNSDRGQKHGIAGINTKDGEKTYTVTPKDEGKIQEGGYQEILVGVIQGTGRNTGSAMVYGQVGKDPSNRFSFQAPQYSFNRKDDWGKPKGIAIRQHPMVGNTFISDIHVRRSKSRK